MFIFLVFVISLAAQLFVFVNLGRLSLSLGTLISLQRSLTALLYVYIFPNSDILNIFWTSIDCDTWPYSSSFYLPLSSAFCSNILLDKLSLVTTFSLLYSIFGSIAVACLLRSLLIPLINFFRSSTSASRRHLALLFQIVLYMIIVDPVLSTYSGSVSKDIFAFSFLAIGFCLLLNRKNLTILDIIAFIISFVIVILDRFYLLSYIGLGLFAGICVQVSRSLLSYHPTLKKSHLTVIIYLVFLFPLVIAISLESFRMQSFDLSSATNSIELLYIQ